MPFFFDATSLQPGDDWKSQIKQAVDESRVFVLCWCCESEKSNFITKEIEWALRDQTKKLVHVLFCSTPLPRPFSERQWIDLKESVMHVCSNHAEQEREQRDERERRERELRERREWLELRERRELRERLEHEGIEATYGMSVEPKPSHKQKKLVSRPSPPWVIPGAIFGILLVIFVVFQAFRLRTAEFNPITLIATVAGLVVVIVAVYLAWKRFPTLLTRIRERRSEKLKSQTEKLADAARRYFEGLANAQRSEAPP
jgi:TIR domain